MNKIVFKGFKVAESYFKLNEVAKENEKYTIAPRFECRLASSGSEFEADFSVSIAAVTEDMPVPFDLKVVLLLWTKRSSYATPSERFSLFLGRMSQRSPQTVPSPRSSCRKSTSTL